jgi:flagellar basal-body rod modification protein FlgD
MAGMWNTVELGTSVKAYDLSDLTNPNTSSSGRVVTSTVSGDSKVVSEGDTSLFKDANALGKDDFLNLLVTQLRFQDPLSPKADTEFVAQLAQFSSLETNKNVETSMTSLADNMNSFMTTQTLNSASTVNASATSLLGKIVRVADSEIKYSGSDVAFDVQVDEGVSSANAAVKNAAGDVIAYRSLKMPSGQVEGEFSWDGLTDDGAPAPKGSYTVEILDATKLKVVGHTYTEGTVSGLRYGATGSKIQVGEDSYYLKDLLSVNG